MVDRESERALPLSEWEARGTKAGRELERALPLSEWEEDRGMKIGRGL
jgi:hypothetical protein